MRFDMTNVTVVGDDSNTEFHLEDQIIRIWPSMHQVDGDVKDSGRVIVRDQGVTVDGRVPWALIEKVLSMADALAGKHPAHSELEAAALRVCPFIIDKRRLK